MMEDSGVQVKRRKHENPFKINKKRAAIRRPWGEDEYAGIQYERSDRQAQNPPVNIDPAGIIANKIKVRKTAAPKAFIVVIAFLPWF